MSRTSLHLALAGAAAFAALSFAPLARPSSSAATLAGTVALKAGTVHLVERGEVLEGGATVLVRDGRILAVGKDVAVPPGARVVDYGPSAVIVPGLVAGNSPYAFGASSRRTADPTLLAVDSFDPYSKFQANDLMGGVTTVYLSPSNARLIGGQGAVVKLAGDPARRVLDESAAIDGTITAAARSVPGYWDPPVPATIDVGLGVVEQQLPGSAFGAGMALREILDRVRGRVEDKGEYGPDTVPVLRELIEARTPWRMGGESAQEIGVLLEFAKAERLPLIIAGAGQSGPLAQRISDAGAAVLIEVNAYSEGAARDAGKGEDDVWPTYDNAAKLVAAGVRVAIATGDGMRPRDLRFAAGIASRGGLSREAALRAITLAPAEMLGVAGRVGSIAPGKDADLCVLTGEPLSSTSSVIATWVDGEVAWKSPASAKSIVIEADALYVGDGRVLRPGQLLVRDGLIAEVGERVSHPIGATVMRGAAAMPGAIDALGFLGLEGSTRVPAADFKLSRIVEPADDVDRRVARAGVTTVVLSPRGASNNGAPLMAYKPAATSSKQQIVAETAALRVQWSERNRLDSGKSVRELLEKAREYDKKWREYEEAIAKWVEPPPEAAAEEEKKPDAKDGEKKDDAKDGEKKDESADAKKDDAKKDEPAKDDAKKDEAKKDDAKKDDSKSKKKGKEEEEADPVSGIWLAKVVVPPFKDEARLRLRLELKGESITGSLRCDSVSTTLVALAGTWKEKKVDLVGLGSRGAVQLAGEAKGGKFTGTLTLGKSEVKLTAERETKELPVAARSEARRAKEGDKPKEPKGKPKKPNVDEKLEPFRRAMKGDGAIVVAVDREDEIRACVAEFEKAGIKPVLLGADEAWRLARELRGRVRGVLLTQRTFVMDEGEGLEDQRNVQAELASAGIPIAFYSQAEEGAADLPMIAAYAVALGLSPEAALRALTSDAATIMGIGKRVGLLAVGYDGDVLLLDGAPLEPVTSVLRTFVNGEEVR